MRAIANIMKTINCKKVSLVCIIAYVGVTFTPCAFSDGVFVWDKGADLYEPEQRAIIFHNKGKEDLIIQAKYEGSARDFAWVIPVPNVPKVKEVKEDLFSELSEYTQRRIKWGSEAAEEHGLELIERKKVGIYDVSILKSKNGEDLLEWLKTNGYKFPEEGKDLLSHYSSKKWYFVAMRVDPSELKEDVENKLHEGTIHPIHLIFKSKKPVYPLKISSLNKGSMDLLIYVFAKKPLYNPNLDMSVYKNDSHEIDNRFKEEGRHVFRKVRPDELPKCYKAISRLGKKKYYLTKLRGSFTRETIIDDLKLKEFKFKKPFITEIGFELTTRKLPARIAYLRKNRKTISGCLLILVCFGTLVYLKRRRSSRSDI